jgi:hypothetical protein
VILGRVRFDAFGPRVFVVGTGERADLPTPPGLMPRHVAVLAVPHPEGIRIRAFTLHPERGIAPFVAGMEQAEYFDEGQAQPPVGGVRGLGRLEVSFDGYILTIETGQEGGPGTLEDIETIPRGEQLAFFNASFLRPVGNCVSSVTGPGGGGHAIPALVTHGMNERPQPGNLVLRSRDGVHRVEPVPHELTRGLLIGRSRRCILGRGFDENDGLSRIHALVLRIDDGVYAFDLASRYGLRDVARPNRLVSTARLDDGIGCLVYGAGHLLFES